ncbi:hypothetical protein [Paeniglutamicibacter cryotolerans]|uniref:Uncharacterized protein n=1 Tax=Paeniglutamicibacter cryotolerans TaxID=670079 RepID=A0A839QMU3_9MICC|nr:hypothetical protein [Paeniglutamicibacter cryotolerans]MBB2997217.1 hypothetical protein [Paeniglutamicibacter cryotolerans]
MTLPAHIADVGFRERENAFAVCDHGAAAVELGVDERAEGALCFEGLIKIEA